MKLKLRELNPNPFKKEINAGELDEETIEKLMANIEQLGLMGTLPVVQIKNKYYLVYGHHRLEALIRKFGIDYSIEVTLHDYSEDQLLRGMIIENLTQRSNDFREELDNLLAIRGYLQNNPACPLSGQVSNISKGKKGFQECAGSIRDIGHWLDEETGTVMKRSKICDILKIADNLDEELLDDVKKQNHATGEKDEEDKSIGIKVATALANFKDKQEQKDLVKAINQTREPHGNKVTKNLTTYKNAPDEIKKQVRQLKLDLADVEEATITYTREDSYEEETLYFQPNFSSQLRSFNKDVVKLEKQVALFNRVFTDKNFKQKYSNLKTKDKTLLDNSIYNIHERIKKCFVKVEEFTNQLPESQKIGGEIKNDKNKENIK